MRTAKISVMFVGFLLPAIQQPKKEKLSLSFVVIVDDIDIYYNISTALITKLWCKSIN